MTSPAPEPTEAMTNREQEAVNWLRPKPDPLACYDCGLPYGDPAFADFVVSDDLWKRISPTGDEGGILCANCIVKRAQMLEIDKAVGFFKSGPFATTPSASARETAEKIVTEAERIIGAQAWLRTVLFPDIAAAIAPYEERIRELEAAELNAYSNGVAQCSDRAEKAEATLARAKEALNKAVEAAETSKGYPTSVSQEIERLRDAALFDIEKAETGR